MTGRRGSTRSGVRAALPADTYVPEPAGVPTEPQGVMVRFVGEDGRTRTFDLAQCPLPGWHRDLAAALALRIGPAGALRTRSSAASAWVHLRRLLSFLAGLPDCPVDPTRLTAGHVSAFHAARRERCGPVYAARELSNVWRLLRLPPLAGQVPAEVLDRLRSRAGQAPSSTPGYSDAELQRILAAARARVAQTRDRIDASEHLLERLATDPEALDETERVRVPALRRLVGSGVSPPRRGALGRIDGADTARRQGEAEWLFVTKADVPAMVVLLMALTGRNVETIKELPARHRVLEARAVELRLTKRRRGAGNWSETVTWEIGRPGRELHHPGGLYLLVHRLMTRSRDLAADHDSFWVFWRNLSRGMRVVDNEHGNPFLGNLQGSAVSGAKWTGHGVLDDAGEPLTVRYTRLRTSIEARRARRMGGHLPSAARSNTVPVLFRNYLRGDPSTVDWAQEVTAEALRDAEAAALAAHRRALAGHGGQLTIAVDDPADTAGGATHAVGPHAVGPRAQDGAWTACRDVEHHPDTDRPCRLSFLDCFHCGNCMITTEHLPRLVSLLDALTVRRGHIPDEQWWTRYGPAWTAIRHDVLPRFSPAELERARRQPAPDALLDVVELPWERP